MEHPVWNISDRVLFFYKPDILGWVLFYWKPDISGYINDHSQPLI